MDYVIIMFALFLLGKAEASITPTCPEDQTICRFQLTIEYRYTMMLHEPNSALAWQPVTAEEDGFYLKDHGDCTSRGPRLHDREAESIITMDGSYQRVLAVNDSVPGPPLVVYHGQQLEITFTNRLTNEVTTIHLHGLHQQGTPWMDGVSQVSQCPINPGESFTYRSIAEPSGTFWYHAHLGDQYTMGIQGALIVLDRTVEQANAKRGDDILPPFSDHFLAMVQDWGEGPNGDSVFVTNSFVHDFAAYSYGLDSDQCYEATKNAVGIETASNNFVSATINGMGWRYTDGVADNPNLPLETYTVEEGGLYRFRLISSSTVYGFIVSVDQHPLEIIAMDGHDVVTYETDYLVIFPGERYDFYINATDPLGTGLYWMRFETLEYYDNNLTRIHAHHSEAIVRYTYTCDDTDCENKAQGAPVVPESYKIDCHPRERMCRMVNCPFRWWRRNWDNITCIHTTEMRSPIVQKELWESMDANIEEGRYQEIFLNMGVWNVSTFGWAVGINGINNIYGSQPVQIFAEHYDDINIACGCEKGEPCRCTNMVEIGLNNTVDLILTSMAMMPIIFGNTHPIHIHGFTPQIVGVGWPGYDMTTGNAVFGTFDIASNDSGINNFWTNKTWVGGKHPDLLGPDAPHKDTVVVPLGGYVILRFRADNPGFWVMHCHTEYHGISGMALVLKVGEPEDMTPAPERMRRCGDFELTEEEFNDAISENHSSDSGDHDRPSLIEQLSEADSYPIT